MSSEVYVNSDVAL